jgi:dephospho-CoA kinase
MLWGVTGCSGTGASTVSAVWRKLGAEVCSLDTTGHRYLNKKAVKLALEAELAIDGLSGMTADEIRAMLRQSAFTSKTVLEGINRVLHPMLVKWVSVTARRLKNSKGVFVLDAALIFELGLEKHLDFVVTVTDHQKRVVERLALRDGVTAEIVAGRWKSQQSLEEKTRKSHFVIQNYGTKQILKQKAAVFYRRVIQRMEESSGTQNQKKADKKGNRERSNWREA